MGYSLERLDRDRAIFDRNPAEQLVNILKSGDPRNVAQCLARALELQIITEEMARQNGVDVSEAAVNAYLDAHRTYIGEQLERAITAFICSVVSQEG